MEKSYCSESEKMGDRRGCAAQLFLIQPVLSDGLYHAVLSLIPAHLKMRHPRRAYLHRVWEVTFGGCLPILFAHLAYPAEHAHPWFPYAIAVMDTLLQQQTFSGHMTENTYSKV